MIQATGIFSSFEVIVRRYPEHVAIKLATHDLSYDAFYAMVVDAMHQLRANLSKVDESVILIEDGDPSVSLSVMLAALGLGVPYSVLSLDMPEVRRQAVLTNLNPQLVVLAKPERKAVFPERRCLYPNLCGSGAAIGSAPSPVTIADDTIAYITYTSGTTGKPKGVMQTHANLMHEVRVHTESLSIRVDDVMSGFYRLSAIGSVRDVFCAFLNGAAYAPCHSLIGTAEFRQSIQKHGITQLHMVPPLFRQFIALRPEREGLGSVRSVFLAGDEVRWDDVQLCRDNFASSTGFYTGIGSSEATSLYTHWFVDDSVQAKELRLPTGWPVPDKQVDLVDPDDSNCVATGPSGEIRVTSRYLSPGYWGEPELTGQVFGLHSGGGTYYLTGDLGRWDAAGRLIHLGRKDRQIKINGQRIEILEVEAALRSYPGVGEVYLQPHQRASKRMVLVAYFTGDWPQPPTVEALHAHMRPLVPEAAIPATFIRVDHFVRTGIGKIQPSALPDPANGSNIPIGSGPKDSPSEREQAIIDLFCQILEIDHAGPNDDFRFLGGDSMDYVNLSSALERNFGIQLTGQTRLSARALASKNDGSETDDSRPSYRSPSELISALNAIVQAWGIEATLPEPTFPLVQMVGPDASESKMPPILCLVQKHQDLACFRALAAERTVWLMPSGVGVNRGDLSSVERLVSDMADVLLRSNLPKVFHLAGVCASGNVALVLAHRLRDLGHPPEFIALVDVFGSTKARDFMRRLLRLRSSLRTRLLPYKWFLCKLTNPTRWKQYILKRLGKWQPAPVVAADRTKAPSSNRITMDVPESESVNLRLSFDSPLWEGRILNIVTNRTWRLRYFIPRLGWSKEQIACMQMRFIRSRHELCLTPKPAMEIRAILRESSLEITQE